MTVRLIKPLGHPLFVSHSASPYYMDCLGDSCRVCRGMEVAKTNEVLDDLIRKLFGRQGNSSRTSGL